MSSIGTKKRIGIIALILAAGFALGYLARGTDAPLPGGNGTAAVEPGHAEHGDHVDLATTDEHGKIVWTCSMHPQIRMDKPGKCPICFMDLIPLELKTGGDRSSLREVRLTPEARKLAGIVTEEVRRLDVSVETRMVGKVDYDETRVRDITAWTGGRVDRMYVDYTGDVVRKGQAMVSVYSPELLTAQAELAQAVKAQHDLRNSNLALVKQSAARTEEAARETLRLLGLTKGQIDAVADGSDPSDHITLYAPQGGVVIGKSVNEGQYVKTGTKIYSIADLSKLWVVLEAYESDLPWVGLGRQVEFQTDAYPGKAFKGKVVYIDPLVSEKTRTVRVRLAVDNADGSLKPGMLVRATQQKREAGKTKGEAPLVIPASAPLITGKRAVVYLTGKQEGTYVGREIVLGPKAGNFYIVRSGLKEGERVVTNGNFKIDSAVQIVAGPSMMNPSTAQAVPENELPQLFVSKLRLLDGTFRELAAAVETRDLSKTHLAFAKFNKDLRLIDGSALKGDAALEWKEVSMLLGNDAMIGAEAPTVERLDEVFKEMKGHYAQSRSSFNLDAGPAALSAPEPFRTQLGKVYAAYEPLQDALVKDDLAGARAAAGKIGEALRGVDAAVLDGPSHNAWAAALAKMTDGLDAIRGADDLVAARTGFEPLSVGLADALRDLGAKTETPVFQLFCPMAFDFKGAIWLQHDEEIRNPYFGTAMSTCGEVQQQLKR